MDTSSLDMMKAACPTRQVLDRVANKWTMLVILALEQRGTLRFSELRRQVEGVTQKMLTQTLRGLERDGMLTRTVIPTVPVTVKYTLTNLGHQLSAAVAVIREWAYDNIDHVESARAEFDARSAASAVHAESLVSGGK
jgi:DNA-binding HxlR family transcriptional regulator